MPNRNDVLRILKVVGLVVGNTVAPGATRAALDLIAAAQDEIARVKESRPDATFAEVLESVEQMKVEDWDDLVDRGRHKARGEGTE